MSASLEITQIEILQQEVLILKDTVLMLSHNIRCLNIRQCSQPIELPHITAVPRDEHACVFKAEGLYDQVTLQSEVGPVHYDLMGIHALDRMVGVDTLILEEDRRYQDEVAYTYHPYEFGADETVWAK